MKRLLIFVIFNVFLTLTACGGGGGSAAVQTVSPSSNQLLVNQLNQDISSANISTASVASICEFSEALSSMNTRIEAVIAADAESEQTTTLLRRFRGLITSSVSQLSTANAATSTPNIALLDDCYDQLVVVATARNVTESVTHMQPLISHLATQQVALTPVADSQGNTCLPSQLDVCNVCSGPGRLNMFQDSDSDGLGELVSQTRCSLQTGFVLDNSDQFISTSIGSSQVASLRFFRDLNIPHFIPFDFDGDGDLDFFHHNAARDADLILLNQGSNSYTIQALNAENTSYLGTTDSVGILRSVNIQKIDFDADGDDDFVLSEAFRDAVLLINNGGRFGHIFLPSGGPAENPTTNNAYSTNAILADLDADGDLDLVDVNNRNVTIWKNRTGGVISETTSFNATVLQNHTLLNVSASDAQVEDLNADGFPDIVLLRESVLKVYKNNCTGVCTTISFSEISLDNSIDLNPGFTTERITLKDMTGDGKKDIVLIARDKILLYTNTSGTNVSFSQATELFDAPESLHHIVIEDIDADGDLDIMTSYPQFRKVVVLKKEGANYVESIVKEGVSLSSVVQVLDTDGDGDKDILSVTLTGLFHHHAKIR